MTQIAATKPKKSLTWVHRGTSHCCPRSKQIAENVDSVTFLLLFMETPVLSSHGQYRRWTQGGEGVLSKVYNASMSPGHPNQLLTLGKVLTRALSDVLFQKMYASRVSSALVWIEDKEKSAPKREMFGPLDMAIRFVPRQPPCWEQSCLLPLSVR